MVKKRTAKKAKKPAPKKAQHRKAPVKAQRPSARCLRGDVKESASPPVAPSRFEGSRGLAPNSFDNRGRG